MTVFLPGSPPLTSDSTKEISEFITDKGDELRWSAFIGGVGAVGLFWWLGSVYRLLRRGEGGSTRLGIVAIAGAVFAAAMATIAGVMLAAIPIIGLRTLGGDGARIFYILSSNLGFATGFGTAVFLGAFSAVIIRSRVLPAALGWIGGLIALVMLAGGASVASTRDEILFVAFTGFFALLLWVLVVSIMMLRGAGSESPGASAS